MFRFKRNALPASIRFGLMTVPLVLQCGSAARLLAQDAPPPTEEQRQARDVLNKGVQDFKNGQHDAAISEFERAKELNPQFLNARLYLANAMLPNSFPEHRAKRIGNGGARPSKSSEAFSRSIQKT
jgi:hypothetical protein